MAKSVWRDYMTSQVFFDQADLKEECERVLASCAITYENVAMLIDFVMRSRSSRLQARLPTCNEFLKRNADACLSDAKTVATLSSLFLEDLFASSDYNVLELTLFHILAEMDLAKRDEMLPLIRLPRIPASAIMKYVLPSGLFDEHACLTALAFQADRHSVKVPRASIEPRCFNGCGHASLETDYDSDYDKCDLARNFTIIRIAHATTELLSVIDAPDGGSADIVFIVGSKRYGSFRHLLALQRDKMPRMLPGELEESLQPCEVPLPQFDRAQLVFHDFLIYLHTGVTEIHDDCIAVLHLYRIAEHFGVARLLERVTLLVKWNAGHWFNNTRKVARLVPAPLLRDMVTSDEYNVPEVALFRILIERGGNERDDLLQYIRFPQIPAKQIMETVFPSGFVDMKRCLEAVAYQADANSVALQSDVKRARCCRQRHP